MKETLRKRLEYEIDKISKRCDQLKQHCNQYKKNNDFENAMKCDIKWRQLMMVCQSLKKLLR